MVNMATSVLEDQSWAAILNMALLILTYIAGFSAQGVSVWYCIKSFDLTKHVFLLLFIDLSTSIAFTVATLSKLSIPKN